MATVSTEYKQAVLESIADSAVTKGTSLLDALKAARNGRVNSTAQGVFVTATAGNGHSVQFALPPNSEVTPVRITEVLQELVNRYRIAKAAIESENDDAILAEMLANLQPVTEVGCSFTEVCR